MPSGAPGHRLYSGVTGIIEHLALNHLVPFGAAALFIFVAAEHDRYRLGSRPARFRFSDQNRASVLVLTARVYLGSVFLGRA